MDTPMEGASIIPFPEDRRVRPAGQTASSSPWTVLVLVGIGLLAWEGLQYALRPVRRRNPHRRHRRAA